MFQRGGPSDSLDMVLAWIQLSAILPLFEQLVAYDHEAREAIEGENLVIQFEVKNGPTAHLRLSGGEIEHAAGTHRDPDIRLTFRTPDRLNRMFAGEDVRPGIRKGFGHLRFLLGGFATLSDRLSYHMEGEGSPPAGDEAHLRFLVEMRLQALLAGTAAIAEHDSWMKPVAESAPAGSMHICVLPDGPRGSLTNRGDGGWSGGCGPDEDVNTLIEFDTLEGVKRLVYEEASLEDMAGLGEARITGNILIAEKANELITRFISVMDRRGGHR